MKNFKINGIFLVVLAAILWGSTGVTGKMLIDTYHVPPLATAAWRIVISAPCYLLICIYQLKGQKLSSIFNVKKSDLKWFVIYGVSVATFQLCYFSSVTLIPVSLASIMALCLSPIFVALLAGPFVGEHLNRNTVIAIVISIVGTVFIVGISGISGKLGNPVGFLLAALAGLSYAFYNICGRNLAKGYAPIMVTFLVFGFAAILLCPALFFTPSLPLKGWLCILYLGLVPSTVAYALFQIGLSSCTSTSAAIASLFEPLTSTILAVVLFGDTFAGSQFIGAIMMVFAIIILILESRKKESERSLK